ncbi:hypothetical protein JOM56_011566 [Amanita muscaria]
MSSLTRTTVNVKPSRLILRDVRPTRMCGPTSKSQADEPAGPSPFQMGSYIPIPFMFPPSWPPQHPYAGMPPGQPNHSLMPSSPPSIETLEIEHWFQALEDDKAHNQKGLNFADHGRILKQNGFQHITQLSRSIVGIKDLQEWLGIDAGIAAFIMEYAQEDVR